MLNQLIICGRLVEEPEIKELDEEKVVSNIRLAVPRNFKNSEGVYETDFINVTLWDSVARDTAKYCKKGDIIGIRGRIQTDSYEKEGNKISKLQVIAEKITFLSSDRNHQNPEPERT